MAQRNWRMRLGRQCNILSFDFLSGSLGSMHGPGLRKVIMQLGEVWFVFVSKVVANYFSTSDPRARFPGHVLAAQTSEPFFGSWFRNLHNFLGPLREDFLLVGAVSSKSRDHSGTVSVAFTTTETNRRSIAVAEWVDSGSSDYRQR